MRASNSFPFRASSFVLPSSFELRHSDLKGGSLLADWERDFRASVLYGEFVAERLATSAGTNPSSQPLVRSGEGEQRAGSVSDGVLPDANASGSSGPAPEVNAPGSPDEHAAPRSRLLTAS